MNAATSRATTPATAPLGSGAPFGTVGTRLAQWREDGIACALARVVATGGSAPLAPGTAMAVSATGEVVGGVSGGCVDAAVYMLCEEVLADGRPVLTRFGPEGDELVGVGPTCGGVIEVFVEPLPVRSPLAAAVGRRGDGHPIDDLLDAVREGRPALATTVLDGPHLGRWSVSSGDGAGSGEDDRGEDVCAGSGEAHRGDDDVAAPVRRGPAPQALAGARDTGVVESELDGRPTRVFLHRFTPPDLLVFGANAFAEALVPLGAQLGYRVTVCDARPVFARADRFPAAAEVVRCWPHEFLTRTPVRDTTAICVLTHDAKFDIPLLEAALRTRAGFIGAMGSRRTHANRVSELRARGVSGDALGRLRSPIGLDLGARTAAETALSIAAELIACRRGGSGAPLVGLDAAIHR